jgi:hypothetical protein
VELRDRHEFHLQTCVAVVCHYRFFITDAVLEWERLHHPPGYDDNPDAPGEPQVVSMNGVLASEACNCVLGLLTGYSGGQRGVEYHSSCRAAPCAARTPADVTAAMRAAHATVSGS